VQGETIVVTADRLAEPLDNVTDSVSVITSEDLRRSQTVSVAEALRSIAGIDIVSSGSLGHTTSAFVRGANSSQVLVLVDGVEINDPFFGGVELGSLLTSGVERIEIVRGAQSPLYGSQAMAGVINIVTAPREGAPRATTLRVEGGSMSTHRESVQSGGGSDALQWKIGGSHLGTAGQFTNDEFRDVQLNGLVRWTPTPSSTLELHGFSGDAHVGIPFNGSTPTPNRNSDSNLKLGGLEYTLTGSPLLHLEVRTAVTDRRDKFRDPDDLFSQTSSSDSTVWRTMAQNTATAGVQTITFGVEQKNEDIRATSNGDPALHDSIHTTAAYVQDKIESGALLLTGGARLDHHSRFGSHTSPRLSAAYQLNDRWRARGAAGSAFRAPSAGELSYPFYGNPKLYPEISRSYEAGLDFKNKRTAVGITAFISKYRDLISFDPVTFIAANIDRASVRGAELTAGASVRDAWRFTAAYTHLQTRDEGTGLPLVRRPRNSASITASYALEVWTASASVNAVGRRFERDFETFAYRYNGGYLTAAVAGSYRLRPGLRLTARIENLFDRRYAEVLAFPAPGRAFYGGLEYGF
jgi:vitamin B12 transporter